MPYSGICEKSVKNSGQICAHHPCSFVVVTADVTKASIDWGHTRLVFSRVAFTLSVQNKAILHLLHTVSKTKKAHGAKIVAQQYSSCLACARLWVFSLELQTANEAEFTNSKPKPPRYGNSSWGQFWLAGETLPCFQKYIIMTLDIFVTSFFFFLLSRTFNTVLPQDDPKNQLFAQTRRGQEVLTKVKQFMKQHIFPAEKVEYERTSASPVSWWSDFPQSSHCP